MTRCKALSAAIAALALLAMLFACLDGKPVDAQPVYAPSAGNLLANPGFEGGTHGDNLHWIGTTGPFTNTYGNINSPDGWTFWWVEKELCARAYTFETGRPEAGLTSDPDRVWSGSQAAKAFTFWRCHRMGLLQQVALSPGEYWFYLMGHAWCSNCSTRPFDPPLMDDCVTPIAAWQRLSVGVDLTGGTDPSAPSVTWGDYLEQYGVYGGPLWVKFSLPTTATVTVFVRSIAGDPLKHDDAYWDAAYLGPVHELRLPFLIRDDALPEPSAGESLPTATCRPTPTPLAPLRPTPTPACAVGVNGE